MSEQCEICGQYFGNHNEWVCEQEEIQQYARNMDCSFELAKIIIHQRLTIVSLVLGLRGVDKRLSRLEKDRKGL